MHVNIQSCDLVSWQQLQALMHAEASARAEVEVGRLPLDDPVLELGMHLAPAHHTQQSHAAATYDIAATRHASVGMH